MTFLQLKDFLIRGSFAKPEKDSVLVKFDLLPENKQFNLGIHFNNNLLEFKGKINMKTQFESSDAFDRIHEVCYELHKGNNGLSKTWKEVEIHIKAPIITKE